MDKQFTLSDLVSFGKFLLSEERKASYNERPDSANQVNDADIKNWLGKQANGNLREFDQVDTSTNAYMGNKKDIK